MDTMQQAYEILRRAGFTVEDANAVLRPGPISERREQRRYEIARDVMAGFATRQGFCDYTADWAVDAVRAADALLAALEAK